MALFGTLGVVCSASAEDGAASRGLEPVTPETMAKGIEAYYAKKKGVQVEFTQTVQKKYQPKALKGKERKGIAFFMKPGFMRWDYQVPEQVFYVSDGVTLWVYSPPRTPTKVVLKGRSYSAQ